MKLFNLLTVLFLTLFCMFTSAFASIQNLDNSQTITSLNDGSFLLTYAEGNGRPQQKGYIIPSNLNDIRSYENLKEVDLPRDFGGNRLDEIINMDDDRMLALISKDSTKKVSLYVVKYNKQSNQLSYSNEIKLDGIEGYDPTITYSGEPRDGQPVSYFTLVTASEKEKKESKNSKITAHFLNIYYDAEKDSYSYKPSTFYDKGSYNPNDPHQNPSAKITLDINGTNPSISAINYSRNQMTLMFEKNSTNELVAYSILPWANSGVYDTYMEVNAINNGKIITEGEDPTLTMLVPNESSLVGTGSNYVMGSTGDNSKLGAAIINQSLEFKPQELESDKDGVVRPAVAAQYDTKNKMYVVAETHRNKDGSVTLDMIHSNGQNKSEIVKSLNFPARK